MSESSVPAEDIIKMCKDQGFLAKQFYVFRLGRVSDPLAAFF